MVLNLIYWFLYFRYRFLMERLELIELYEYIGRLFLIILYVFFDFYRIHIVFFSYRKNNSFFKIIYNIYESFSIKILLNLTAFFFIFLMVYLDNLFNFFLDKNHFVNCLLLIDFSNLKSLGKILIFLINLNLVIHTFLSMINLFFDYFVKKLEKLNLCFLLMIFLIILFLFLKIVFLICFF